jgi:hypothetical protein
MAKKFRERFCLPYPNFLQLVVAVFESKLFDRWCGHKSNNKQALPIELLVLGSLRYLGRGWTFNNVEDNTAISKEVHRTFFHHFVKFGSTVLYDKYVLTLVFVNKAKTHMREFEEAGFPGCVGSSDATHKTTNRCEYDLKNNHLGLKSSLTAWLQHMCQPSSADCTFYTWWTGTLERPDDGPFSIALSHRFVLLDQLCRTTHLSSLRVAGGEW